MKLYLVGGAVRDKMLGLRSNDLDFAVEADSYDEMKTDLLAMGLHVWMEQTAFVTLRGTMEWSNLPGFFRWLKGYDVRPDDGWCDADFTLCRAETQYSDKRHPDTVTPASLLVDLSRRDFTVNAMAVDDKGTLVDPFGGMADIMDRKVRCVGNPYERFEEDPLRLLRALRFAVCKNLSLTYNTSEVFMRKDMLDLLGTLPHERVRDELNKMLKFDWYQTMNYLMRTYPLVGDALNRHHSDLWFKCTAEGR